MTNVNIVNVFLQIIFFQMVFIVIYVEDFKHCSMLHQFNVQNISQDPGRVNLPCTLELGNFS